MPPLLVPGLALLAALAVSLAAVPLITRLAVDKRLLDIPDGIRRKHPRPVPRLGGIAVFAGLVAAMVALEAVDAVRPGAFPPVPHITVALLIGAAILFLIGLVDDLQGVPPFIKLAAQSLAAYVVWDAGFRIDSLSFAPGYELHLGLMGLPLMVVWLVGVSNAFNLVDGLDGLAGGVGVVGLLVATASATMVGSTASPLYALALTGALLGFLRYNFAPARIFMGDSGSLVVGFLLAVLTVRSATTKSGTVHAFVPIFALSYPLLDTGFSMLRRWLRGDPLSRADGRHIHHQLLALGLSPRQAVGVIYVQSVVIGVLGLFASFSTPAMTLAAAALGGIILLAIFVFGVRWLDYHEFAEASASVSSAARKARGVIRDRIHARDVACLIRLAKSLDEVDAILGESAEIFRFAHMQLRRGPGRRESPERLADDLNAARLWTVEYPITVPSGAHGHAPVTLVIWCHTSVGRRPYGAERVAQILAPALEQWITPARLESPSRRDHPLDIREPGRSRHHGEIDLDAVARLRA